VGEVRDFKGLGVGVRVVLGMMGGEKRFA
jgi:hypothetical protein